MRIAGPKPSTAVGGGEIAPRNPRDAQLDFGTRFIESYRILWLIAAGIVQDRTAAEDVVQEAAVIALGNLSIVEQAMGNYERARELMVEVLGRTRELGDWVGVGIRLNSLAHLHQTRGEWKLARAYIEQGLEVAEKHAITFIRPHLLVNLAHVAFSACLGFYVGLGKLHRRPVLWTSVGLVAAIVPHGLYDLFLFSLPDWNVVSLLGVLPISLVLLGLRIRWSHARSPHRGSGADGRGAAGEAPEVA